MKIKAQTAQGEVVSEGVKTFVLQELRGPQPREYTNREGNTVHIEQSFRMGVKVADGPEANRMAWDTIDVDGPMGWRFVALADACLGKRHKKGDDIETEALLGKKFVATVKHSPSKGGDPFTNLADFTAATAPRAAGPVPPRGLRING